MSELRQASDEEQKKKTIVVFRWWTMGFAALSTSQGDWLGSVHWAGETNRKE